jgi:hypothetical protein
MARTEIAHIKDHKQQAFKLKKWAKTHSVSLHVRRNLLPWRSDLFCQAICAWNTRQLFYYDTRIEAGSL